MEKEKLTFWSKKETMYIQLSSDFVQAAIEADSVTELNQLIALMNSFEERWYKELQNNPIPKSI